VKHIIKSTFSGGTMKRFGPAFLLGIAATGLFGCSTASGGAEYVLRTNALIVGQIGLTPSRVNDSATWPSLDYVPTVPAVRSEIRLFPLNGTNTNETPEPGGEVTISQWDLRHLNADGDYQLFAMYAYPDGYRLQSQAHGTQKPLPILFDAMAGYITFAINTDGTLGIKNGISNTEMAGGFAHQRTPSCTGPTCQLPVVWQTSFVDTNYTVTCSLGGAVGVVNWANKTTNGLTAVVNHMSGSDGGEIDCIAVHD
jgi:hypothetical protein